MLDARRRPPVGYLTRADAEAQLRHFLERTGAKLSAAGGVTFGTNERGGYSRRLPDLVFWPVRDRRRQAAVVIAPGLINPRRERAALEGWQRCILAGQYAQVHYVSGPAFVSHLRGVAEAIGAAPQLLVGERAIADEHPVLASVIENVDEESVA